MKSILLTTTALVAFAGAAAADGHASVSWSGTATAGVARDGGEAGSAGAAEATIEALIDGFNGDAVITAEDLENAVLEVVELLAELDGGDAFDAEDLDAEVARALVNAGRIQDLAEAAADAGVLTSGELKDITDQIAAHAATAAQLFGTPDPVVGDFEDYAEINAAVTGTVATDLGVTLSATASLDVGRGYDFADDDGFDTGGNNVSFDNIVVDAGAFGKLTMAPNDLAHLVDDDDDSSADFMYENDFGVASVAFVMDIDEDGDAEAADESWALVAVDTTDPDFVDPFESAPAGALGLPVPDTILGVTTGPQPYFETVGDEVIYLTYSPAVAADVQWSAKVSAPIADIATVYAAFDEEGGYDVGASATIEGITINAKAKNEALAVAKEADTEFDVSASYTIAGLTVGAGYNTIDDGDQWRINGSYTIEGLTVSASTDEGEDWEVTGSYALAAGASIEAGVNYTEDAFVGVSFSF